MPDRRRILFGRAGENQAVVGARGYWGRPAAPNRVGDAWPDSDNVMLAESGDALRATWGYRRTLSSRLWDGVKRERLEIWEVPADKAFGQDSGVGIVVVDGVNGRILGIDHLASAQPTTFNRLVALMNRQGNHDYPSIVNTRGKSHIFTGWTEPMVHDGEKMRLMGIRPPRRKPVVDSSGATATDGGKQSIRNDRYQWDQGAVTTEYYLRTSASANPGIAKKPESVFVGGVDITLSEGTPGSLAEGEWFYGDEDSLGYDTVYVRLTGDVDPNSQAVDHIQIAPMRLDSMDGDVNVWLTSQGAVTAAHSSDAPTNDGTPYLKLTLTSAVAKDDLATVELAGEVIPPPNATAISIWVYNGGSFPIGENVLRLRLADATGQTGRIQDFPIKQTINAGWNQVFLDYSSPSDTPTFDVKSMAIALDGQLPPDAFKGGDLELRFDQFRFIETKESSGTAGRYRVIFTWFDSKRLRESDPSPESDLFSIPADGDFSIDISGGAGLTSGSQNINPALHSIADSNHSWVLSGSGTDEYYLRDNNGENPVVSYQPVNVYEDGAALTFATPGTLSAGQWGFANNDGLADSTVYVRLTASGDPNAKADGSIVYQDDTVDRVRVYLHREEFGADEFGNAIYGIITDNLGSAIPFQSGPDFAASINFGSTFDEQSLLVGLKPNYHNGPPQPVASAVLDGDVIFAGGQEDFSVGEINVDSADKSVVSPVQQFAATPRFRHWMEKRRIFIKDDPKLYVVHQVYSTLGYGMPDRIRIGTVDPFTGVEIDGYEGTAGDKEYRIEGETTKVFWTAKTADPRSGIGVNTEAMPLANFLELRMPGDSISAVARIRENVIAAGRKTINTLIQEKSAIDDAIASLPRYSQPLERSGLPGVLARRTTQSLPGGDISYLAVDADLMLGTPGQFQKSPLSVRTRGFLSNQSEVDSAELVHAHSIYIKKRDVQVIHAINFDQNAAGCETAQQVLDQIEGDFEPEDTGEVLVIGNPTGSFIDSLQAAISATNGNYAGDTEGEDFETVTDLSGIDTIIVSELANDELDSANPSDARLWNPNAAVRAKIEAFLTAGGTAIILGGGFQSAVSTNPNSLNGAGNAWTWLPHGHSDHSHPASPTNLMVKGHIEDGSATGISFLQTHTVSLDPFMINGASPVPDSNHGFFLNGHYIVRNMFADRSVVGNTSPPAPVGDQVYDFNFHDKAWSYLENHNPSLQVVAFGGAYPGNTPVNGVNDVGNGMSRFPIILAGAFGAGRVIYMGSGSNYLTDDFGDRLLENCLNWLNLPVIP